MLQSIQQQNGLAILDIDDLVFDSNAFSWISSPDFQDPVRAALYQEDMRRNRLTLERCQAVITSTQYLGYRPISNLGGSIMSWTAQTSTPDLIHIIPPSGRPETSGVVVFTINVAGRSPGTYTGTIDVDAGNAGNEQVTVTVYIFNILLQSFLPFTSR